jgi:hypothetical protein
MCIQLKEQLGNLMIWICLSRHPDLLSPFAAASRSRSAAGHLQEEPPTVHKVLKEWLDSCNRTPSADLIKCRILLLFTCRNQLSRCTALTVALLLSCCALTAGSTSHSARSAQRVA